MERLGPEGSVGVSAKVVQQRPYPPAVDWPWRQRQAVLAIGSQASHRKFRVESAVRFSQPVDATGLLYEHDLRGIRFLPNSLRRSNRDYPKPLGDHGLSRPSLE